MEFGGKIKTFLSAKVDNVKGKVDDVMVRFKDGKSMIDANPSQILNVQKRIDNRRSLVR